ncbi:MAG: hypothetical protein ACLU0O_03215 [Collinsella sp.]
MFTIDGSDETGHVCGTCPDFADEDGDHDFGIMGDVDLDAARQRRGHLQKLPRRLYRGPARG